MNRRLLMRPLLLGLGLAIPIPASRFQTHMWALDGSSGKGIDTEVLAHYGMVGKVATGTARLSAELTGAAILSQGGLSLSERTVHSLTLSAGCPWTVT